MTQVQGRSGRRAGGGPAVGETPSHPRAACGLGPGRTKRRSRGRVTPSSRRARTGPTRSACWSTRPRPGSRSWCRSATAACWSRRSPSTGARRSIMAADLAATPAVGCHACSCAATPTCRTSACSPHRNAASSSTSTTSTRPCPARGSGTSSGSRPASRSPAGTTGSPRRSAARSSATSAARVPRAMREFAAMPTSTSGTPTLDVDELLGSCSRRSAKRAAAQDARARRRGQGADARTACRRSTSSPTWSTGSGGSSPTRRSSCRSTTRRDAERGGRSRSSMRELLASLPAAACRPTAGTARAVSSSSTSPARSSASAASGPVLDRAAARARRQRPAVPAGQGGRGVGARAVRRHEPVRATTASGSWPASA